MFREIPGREEGLEVRRPAQGSRVGGSPASLSVCKASVLLLQHIYLQGRLLGPGVSDYAALSALKELGSLAG